MSKDKNKINYAPNSPLLKACMQPAIKELQHGNYGVRKLQHRVHSSKTKKINSRH